MAPPFWLSRDEVRSLDRRAIDGYGVPGIVLMENAGRGCAELLMRLNPEKQPTVIVAGPGNNGGDGFVIARHLDNRGWPVDVHVIAKNNPTPGDADVNFDILFAAGIPYTQYHPDHFGDQQARFLAPRLSRAGWIVDALFGTGLTRALAPPYSIVVEAINAANRPVLAIDVPSGIDCDTGEPILSPPPLGGRVRVGGGDLPGLEPSPPPQPSPLKGEGVKATDCEYGPAVRAAHTATFVALKKGMTHPASREWTGDISVIDIGAPRKLVDEFRDRRAAEGA